MSKSKLNPEPDYKALFNQAIYHLRVMCGSRNSLTPEAIDRVLNPKDPNAPSINLRTEKVEAMHQEAYKFWKEHDQ